MKLQSKKITKWREVKTVDELRAALNDVRGPGFGQVGHHIGYKVSRDVIKDAGDLEDRMIIEHAGANSYPRLDAKEIGNYSSGVVVKRGRWNDRDMEYPIARVQKRSSSSPDIPRFGVGELFFSLLFFAWVPLQFWIEHETEYKAATWWLCGPLPVFMVLFGIARLVRELRDR